MSNPGHWESISRAKPPTEAGSTQSFVYCLCRVAVVRERIEGESMNEPVLSTLRCPSCGTETPAEMPPAACLYFFDCPACGALLNPRPGDCCVFCSYGPAPCPSAKRARPS
jgi:hypothetical protein